MALHSRWVGNLLRFFDGATDILDIDGANGAVDVKQASGLKLAGTALTPTAATLNDVGYKRSGRNQATTAVDKTLTIADAGIVQVVTADGKVVTLPATHVGDVYLVENGGADGTVGLSISPQAADKISGAGLTAADNKDLINTKATAKKGDYVKLIADGVDGFVVAEMVGTWAREA